MNTFYYIQFTNICWIIIGLYWLINAWNTKQTIRKQNIMLRWAYLLALAFSFILIYGRFHGIAWMRMQVLPQNDITGISGCLLCAGGIVFAIWARYVLADNWSGNVTLKKDHKLIRSGPYSIVRHPIYTGALMAMIGSALVSGEVKGLIAVLICFIGFWHKLRMEEQLMIEQFPEEYPVYRRQVSMLIPFLL